MQSNSSSPAKSDNFDEENANRVCYTFYFFLIFGFIYYIYNYNVYTYCTYSFGEGKAVIID